MDVAKATTEARPKKPESIGTCSSCGGQFTKRQMTRHLEACILAQEAAETAGKSQPRQERFFHILVEGQGMPEYWLHIEMRANAQLTELDAFLRDIWLECCGHLSQFTIDRTYFISYDDPLGRDADTRRMNVRLADVLEPGMTFEHEYDFGTSTYLKLRVLSERVGLDRRDALRLLARNNPLDWRCAVCGKPATLVCSTCIYTGIPAWYCDEHQSEHTCPQGYDEAYFLPVANSPRVGMCGYTG